MNVNVVERDAGSRLKSEKPEGGAGLALRMQRLFAHRDHRSLILGVDHPLFEGHVPGLENIPTLLAGLAEDSVDALLTSPATVRLAGLPGIFGKCRALRLDTTSAFRDHDAGNIGSTLVTSADELVRSGADAAACFFLVNAAGAQRVGDHREHLVAVAGMCRRLGFPVMVEALVVDDAGRTVRKTADILHAARLAYELGADVLKIDAPETASDLATIVEAIPAPICIRGGVPRERPQDTLSDVAAYIRGGAAGVVFGRSIFQARDPAAMLRDIHRVIHD
jgi:DhnA family fructose-bisphosphate aldolase class Ia